MSNIKNVFDISGRAMAAQLIRLNTVASNLANAGNIAGSKEEAYKAIKPVFETKFAEHAKTSGLATVDAVETPPIVAPEPSTVVRAAIVPVSSKPVSPVRLTVVAAAAISFTVC